MVPIVLLVGVLIGSIGIGGVYWFLALTYLTGVEIHIAIAACMLSYGFSARSGRISTQSINHSLGNRAVVMSGCNAWSLSWPLVVSVLPARTITFVMLSSFCLPAINALRNQGNPRRSTPASQITVDFLRSRGGFGSAISGTGGPLLLVPLLVWLNWPVLTAVGLSQIIQLPISALATVGNYLHGQVDVMLALSIAVVMIVA